MACFGVMYLETVYFFGVYSKDIFELTCLNGLMSAGRALNLCFFQEACCGKRIIRRLILEGHVLQRRLGKSVRFVENI